jgi:Cys-rich four helix bundle protein (predicted Tat secretion target)
MHDHEHMHHHGGTPHQALIDAASGCVSKADICLAHCHELLAAGDKSLGACTKTASEVLALCTALRSIAAQNAPSLPRLASVALDSCKRCEAECRKHEKMHEVCKNCADACAACAVECKKAAA